jgi:hypothetical protein
MIPRVKPKGMLFRKPDLLFPIMLWNGRVYISPKAANQRRIFGVPGLSAAEIIAQKAEQVMVLPRPVDAEIAARHAFARETAFLEHADG